MSEPQITHVEQADHVEHADKTEKAGTVVKAESVESVENLNIDSGMSDKVRKLRSIRDIAMLVVMLAALAALVLVFLGSNSQSDRNADLIRSLRVELDEKAAEIDASRALIESNRQEDADKLACAAQFVTVRDGAFGVYVSSLGALVTVIASTTPGADRDGAVGDGIQDVTTANDVYTRAVAAVLDYEKSGHPLPCPLGSP